MPDHSKENKDAQAAIQDFVTVVFAEDLERAIEYKNLLNHNDIAAVIKDDEPNSLRGTGVPVMVPEDCLDEAHVLIESHDAYDDFYDYAFEDTDDEFFDDVDDEFDDSF